MGEANWVDAGDETEGDGEYAVANTRVEAEGAWEGVAEVSQFEGE